RDYVLRLNAEGGAPILNIFGGKITTYRKLAEHALEKLAEGFDVPGAAWTAGVAMPGGDFKVHEVSAKIDGLAADYPFLSERWAKRLIRAYGTEAWDVLADAKAADDLGQDFGATLTEREVNWLIAHEYVRDATDIVWRRSKLGLRLDAAQIDALQTYVENALAEARAA
ncbi:MAG: glycerol-3-phosphate dehydrogenase C-terminal domain-containing protein, partial [Pseudomonadota bacterium]